MADVATLRLRIDGREAKTAATDLDRLGRASKGAEREAASLGRTFKTVQRASAAFAGSLVVRAIIQAADGYKELNARLQLVSKNTGELARSQFELLRIAQSTRVGLQQTGDLYTSLARSTQSLGVSQDDLLRVTESINKALIISGTSAQSAQAALVQLGQGFASGALRGEELNSVLEQAPRLAQAIADGLGVPIGQLRELGKAGELSAEKVFGALQKSAARLDAEFAGIPLTVGQATTKAANAFSVLIGAIDESTGSTEGLASAIGSVSDAVAELAQNIRRANEGAEEVGFLARAFTIISQTVRILWSDVVFVFEGIEREVVTIGKQLLELPKALAKADFTKFTAISDAAKADAIRARQELDKYQQQVLNPFLNSRGRGFSGFQDPRLIGTTPAEETVGFRPRGGGTTDGTRPSRSAGFTGTTYAESIAQAVAGAIESSDVARAKELADQIAYLDKLYFEAGLSAEVYESAMAKLTGTTSSAAESTSELVAKQARLAQLLGATESAGIEKQREDMKLLAEALRKDTITEQQYLEAVTARLDLVAEKTEESTALAESLQRALGDDLADALDGNFEDIGDSFAKLLKRMVAEAAAADLINALGLGKNSGSGSNLGNLFSSFSGFFGGPKATGGPVSAGMTYLVGEKGPELFTPHVSGAITPNEQLSSAAGGTNVTVYQSFTVGDVATVSQVRQAVAGSEARIASSLARSMKYGGAPV